ncbi:MAG TPA: M67 family metallopeptidase [Candidatus Micrarchaeaceae archaeon]|nr:M67 family metallopeptidase [Candidatus Micrarchaeaceae archaeon]
MSLAGPGELFFPGEIFARMTEYAETAYPYEGCGVLVGSQGEELTAVSEVFQGHNLVEDRRRDRYELDPRDIIQAEREARRTGQEVIGFYHTHPDHPARPSQFDTDRAWPGYHYVVISVAEGHLAEATAWRLVEGEEPNRFEEVPLSGGHVGPGYNPAGLVAEVP